MGPLGYRVSGGLPAAPMAPGIQNHAQEWSSGNSKNTKWPTVGSAHSKSCPGMEFWELEDHEVRY
eukprot:713584-Pyramimonas_sp.AAC.1